MNKYTPKSRDRLRPQLIELTIDIIGFNQS
jgi:hypothetical protein